VMALKTVWFLCLFFVALALAPAMAHLLALPNKINMPREQYLIVQQIYRGWALLGTVVIGALLSTLALTIVVRKHPKTFVLTLITFLCIAGTQVLFWTFTFPANQQTHNWTVLPENWLALRQQWEYSHAASASLNLVAFVALILAVLSKDE
jgi:ribose/xylose/arabinose/galactoside ABC-type transport system permease subunit